MQTSTRKYNILKELILSKKLINVSGSSGSGKTTFVLEIVSNFLLQDINNENSCVWIQACEQFPKKRLSTMFQATSQDLIYLKLHFFIIPKSSVCRSLQEQNKIIKKMLSTPLSLPPDVKFIVIDNISHHLRYERSLNKDFQNASELLDSFYEEVMMPIMLFCLREDIYLFLIHEISYNPDINRSQPFFWKLYERLNMVNITLESDWYQKTNILKIFDEKNYLELPYVIYDMGFKWI